MTVAKAIARAWKDPTYKLKLTDDPHAALADVGVTVAAGTAIKVLENTADTVHLVLPQPPEGTVTDDELERIAGGAAGMILPSDQN